MANASSYDRRPAHHHLPHSRRTGRGSRGRTGLPSCPRWPHPRPRAHGRLSDRVDRDRGGRTGTTRPARPGQRPLSPAHDPVPRSGRRPGAGRLAHQPHLPGRGPPHRPGDGVLGQPAGRGRTAARRGDLRGRRLLPRGRGGARLPGCRPALCGRPGDHRLPGPGRAQPGPQHRGRGRVPRPLAGPEPAHHPGPVRPLALHGGERHPATGQGAGPAARGAAVRARGRDPGRDPPDRRTARTHAHRPPGRPRGARRRHHLCPLRLGERDRPGHPGPARRGRGQLPAEQRQARLGRGAAGRHAGARAARRPGHGRRGLEQQPRPVPGDGSGREAAADARLRPETRSRPADARSGHPGRRRGHRPGRRSRPADRGCAGRPDPGRPGAAPPAALSLPGATGARGQRRGCAHGHRWRPVGGA